MVKTLIEGVYENYSTINPVLFSTVLSCSSSSADSITVQLHDQFNPSIEFSEKRLMDINNQFLNLPVGFYLLGSRIRG